MTGGDGVSPEAPETDAPADSGGARPRFKRRNWTKAEVYVLPGNPPLLVKDYGRCVWPVRIAGRLFLAIEERALRRLVGVQGVPRLVRRIGGNALCMEYIEARPLSELEGAGRLPADFADRLERLFDEIEQRGVSHGDPHFSNILCDAAGRPWLVDFAFAYVHGSVPLLDGWIRRNLDAVRRRRMAKLKHRFLGQPGSTVEVGRVYGVLIRLKRLYRRLKHLRPKRGS